MAEVVVAVSLAGIWGLEAGKAAGLGTASLVASAVFALIALLVVGAL